MGKSKKNKHQADAAAAVVQPPVEEQSPSSSPPPTTVAAAPVATEETAATAAAPDPAPSAEDAGAKAEPESAPAEAPSESPAESPANPFAEDVTDPPAADDAQTADTAADESPVMPEPLSGPSSAAAEAPQEPASSPAKQSSASGLSASPAAAAAKDTTKSREASQRSSTRSLPEGGAAAAASSSSSRFGSWFRFKPSASTASLTTSNSATQGPPRVANKSLTALIKESRIGPAGTLKQYELVHTATLIEAKPVEDNFAGFFAKGCHYLIIAATAKSEIEAHFLFPETTPLPFQVEAISAFEAEGTEANVFRQIVQHESIAFRKLFVGGIVYVDDMSERVRLLRVRTHMPFSIMYAEEVVAKVFSLSHSDVFVLDLGRTLYVFNGDCADYKEKQHGKSLAMRLKIARSDTRVAETIDEDFWLQMSGTRRDVVMRMTTPVNFVRSKGVDQDNATLYWIGHNSDESTTKYLKVHRGRVYPKMLRSKDAYLVDFGEETFIWVGKDVPPLESHWLRIAMTGFQLEKRRSSGMKDNVTVSVVYEGQPHRAFDSFVYSGRSRHSRLAIDDDEMTVVSQALYSLGDSFAAMFASCSGERDLEQKIEREWNLVDCKVVDEEASQLGGTKTSSSALAQI